VRKHKLPKDRIIFYLPYSFGDLETGSKVRPYKMYQSFLRLGYKVDLIAGTPDERITKYKEVLASGENYAFCYAEASSYPLHPILDYRVLLGIRRLAIPMGIYYRDAYWKFEDYFPYKGVKRLELLLRYHTDLLLFSQIASVMFFPTDSLSHLFKLRIPKIILPPGGEYRPLKREFTRPLRAVYVGGVTYRYGIQLMLEALEFVNQEKVHLVLELVCRRNELEALPQHIQMLVRAPWVNIHHISGDALQSIYSRCHIGLIPGIKDAYNDLAFPVKMFEYLSFGLPIVATHCKEMSKFIKTNGCGIICRDDAQSMADTLNLLTHDLDTVQRLSVRAVQTILNGNLWEDRAKLVANTLDLRGAN